MLSLGLSCAGCFLRPNRRFKSSIFHPSSSSSLSLSLCSTQLLYRFPRLLALSHYQHNNPPPSPPPPLPTTANRNHVKMENADSGKKLCTRMRLWELPDQYVVEPTDGTSDSCLSISRVDGSLNLVGELPQLSSIQAPKIRSVYGVLGILKLVAGTYMVVIADRECVGSYMGHPIFRVSSLQILPCNHSLKCSSSEQKKMETEFSVLLNAAESTSGLYFSYDVNLTLSAQKLHDLGDEAKLLPLWRQADSRFLWNNHMLEVLIDNKLEPYLLPVVQGSFQNFQAAIGRKNIDVTLISRRCTRRAVILR